MNSILWIENPTVFIKDQGYLKFIPTRKSNKIEQINSLSLMLIYLFVILYLFKLNNSITNTLIFGILFIMIVLYYGYYSNKEKLNTSDDDNENDESDDNTISIESGYYDSNGKMHIGPFYSHKFIKEPIDKKSYNQIKSYLNDTSRKPTPDNPFMNPILTDFNNESDPRPANVDDDEIKNEIRQSFNKDLFRDMGDLFDVRNAERIFYNVPGGSIPNDQDAFAKWCYGLPPTCHEDTMSCEKNIYEDLRYRNNYK